jgi:hypothetical protein
MTTTRVLAGLVSNGNILADGTITPEEVGIINISGVTYPGDDQAANPAGGQTITINGAGFLSTPTVYVGGVIAPSVSFISSTQITFTSPAKTAGTYDIYVVNPSGSTAIRVYGISYSGTPTWTTPAGELGPVDANFTIQLVAAGDAPVTYALTSGSTLPSGVTLSSAGLITGSALTVEQTFNFSVDAIDGQAQETPRSFAVTVSLADPYFKYVSMLLSGDPLVTPFSADASTNNFNLSINGNARSNNFTPYQGNGYYSNYFDGSGDYLTVPSNAAFTLGSSGDFTIECWVYLNVTPSDYTPFATTWVNASSSYANRWFLGIGTLGRLGWFDSVGNFGINESTSITLNTWLHIAVVRSGSTITLYKNGLVVGTQTTNQAYTTDNALSVGFIASGSSLLGSLSNLRIVKGTAVYTSTFTPPTTPLTAITNTSLLTCQSNRFIDNSTNAFAITVSGNTAIAPAQPFTLPSGVATYGSGYFDGAGDTLTTSANTAFAFPGDFTIEFWAYKTADTSGSYDIAFGTGEAGTGNNGYFIELSATRGFVFAANNAPVLSYSMNPNTSAWNHYAVTRSGSTLRLFVGGSVVASTTYSTSIPSTTAVRIGGTSNDFFGYLADVRVVKGTAVYITTYTLPTAPLTAISGTSLLTAQYNGGGNNSGFKDSSQNNFVIARNGNTTQGTFSPYGNNWSNYFSSNSGLTAPNNSAFKPATNDFTVECWIFQTSSGTEQAIYGDSNSATDAGTFDFNINSTGFLKSDYWTSSTAVTTRTSTLSPTVNQWNHVVLSRTGTTMYLGLNGVLQSFTAPSSYQSPATTYPTVGRLGAYTAGIGFIGYISNFRYINGTNLYSGSSYTVPTAPLTAVTNTKLLTCADNRFIDDSTNAFTLTVNGSPSVQRFSPFSPTSAYSTSVIGGSGYFDGTGDRLSSPANTAINLSTADFTAECWVYPTSFSSTKAIFVYQNADASNTNYGYWLTVKTTGVVRFENFSGSSQVGFDSTVAMNLNTWNHIAVTRTGTSATTYVNGVGTSGTVSATFNAPSGAILNIGDNFGASFGSSNPYAGYITDLRIVKGTRVYTSNFTPPTAPLTAITNTSLLLNNTNAGILDNAMMNDLETVGNAQISTSVKKYGTGSMYFDGTGDGLFARSTPDTAFGTSDFTVEFWLNLSANLGSFVKIVQMGTSGNCFTIETQSSTNVLTVTNLTSTVYLTSSSALTTGTWIHVAVTRASGTLRIFQNGTQTGSVSNTVDFPNAGGIYIGQSNTGQAMNGYIDDLRVTKGYARYIANFTPPSAPFKGK